MNEKLQNKTVLQSDGFLIEKKIFTIRCNQVIIDRDLAELYGVETKRINEQVKRNIERFPERFRFQLTDNEIDELVAKCDRFGNVKYSSVNPYAYTEQGVAMLATVLRSETAIKVSIQIVDAFVELRKLHFSYSYLLERINGLEIKQIEMDARFSSVLSDLQNSLPPIEGIFYQGQIFDAYKFANDLVRSANKRIVLVDNYVDDTTLSMLAKRKETVSATIYTGSISRQLEKDLEKYNTQYPPIDIVQYAKSHDRFIVIDDIVYFVGASFKDLGKKMFAFAKLEIPADEFLKHL